MKEYRQRPEFKVKRNEYNYKPDSRKYNRYRLAKRNQSIQANLRFFRALAMAGAVNEVSKQEG